ncbi:MAG: hypothetical protein AAGA92_11995 [Planctomycetota bacterium]
MNVDRPLVWLLIVASAVLDFVLWRLPDRAYTADGVLTGLVLGQVGVLAAWAAFGRGHRLGRAGLLVAVTAALAVWTGSEAPMGRGVWLAVLAVYTAFVAGVAAAVDAAATRLEHAHGHGERFRLPLMELFGWTIVAAAVSFGARHMDFQPVFRSGDFAYKTAAVLLTPFAGVWVVRLGMRRFVIPLVAAVAVAGCLSQVVISPRQVFREIVAAQAAYVATAVLLWRFLRRGARSLETDEGAEPAPDAAAEA